jgi:hypothetical protein
MSGSKEAASVRQNVLLFHAAAERGIVGKIDLGDRLSQGAAGRPARSSVASAAMSARRSIAISALALAYQSRSSVLDLLRSC